MKLMDSSGYFEIIIWILLAVAGIGIKAFQNLAKQKQQNGKKTVKDIFSFPDFESMGDTSENEEYEEEPVYTQSSPLEPQVVEAPKPVVKEIETIKEDVAAFVETKDELLSDDPDSLDDMFTEDLIKKQGDKLFGENVVEESKSIDFDLRRAVIYSEILKPKYL